MRNPQLSIPQIVHQTSRTERTDPRWRHAIQSVKRYHQNWQYILWTHERSMEYVEQHHPKLFPIFAGFERNIMRADVIRYVAMHDMGGMYCDLDYEFLRPYNYAGKDLVLGMEFDKNYGDAFEQVAGFVFASAPGHHFWKDVLDEVLRNPPKTETYQDVVDSTGPGFITRIFMKNRERYEGLCLEPRPVFSPFRMRGRNERELLLNSGMTHGIHHACGSWKERWTLAYLRRKLEKALPKSLRVHGKRPLPQPVVKAAA